MLGRALTASDMGAHRESLGRTLWDGLMSLGAESPSCRGK